MKVFVSYRRSIDSTDRLLRQFVEYFQRSIDIRQHYRVPLLNGGNAQALSLDTVLDLQLARPSSGDATLIIALATDRSIRNLDGATVSRLSDQTSIVENILSSGLHRLASWKDHGQRPARSIYRDCLSIGIGNAVRKTLAIKRLLLLRIPEFIPVPNWTRTADLNSLPPNNLDELILREFHAAPMPDEGAVVNSAVAGIALLTGDQDRPGACDTLHIWDPSHVFRTPEGEERAWNVTDGAHAEGAPLARFHGTPSHIIQSNVDELSARIVLEKFDGLVESDFLALQEGIVDRGKRSRFSSIHRLLQRIRLRSAIKTPSKLTKDSKHRTLRRGKRGTIVRPVARPTVLQLLESGALQDKTLLGNRIGKLLTQSRGGGGLTIGNAELWKIGSLIATYRGGGASSSTPAVTLDQESGFAEGVGASDAADNLLTVGDDAEQDIFGTYVSYRCEFGGRDASRVWREVLQVRTNGRNCFVSMSAIDERSARPRAVRISEGELRRRDGALLFVEKQTQRNSPTRIVCMFPDEAGWEDSVPSCRIGAAADVRGPGVRRLAAACTLLVRVRWNPVDTREFMEKATRAGTFDEIIRSDFGNDESDLNYIERLLRKADVGEHLKARISQEFGADSSREKHCDLDLHPQESGLDDILGRVMADSAIAAPFKPGWSGRSGGLGNREPGGTTGRDRKKS